MLSQQRNQGCRLLEYSIHGHAAVTLENKSMRISVVAGRGANIFEFLDKSTDTDFMYRDSIGFNRLAGIIPTKHSQGGNFWDYHIGGWYELFPNSGRETEAFNAQLGRHGEVMLLPWEYSILEDSPDRVRVQFIVRTVRMPFLLKRTMELRSDKPVLFIEEELTNTSGEDLSFLWGHHVTFGDAFINENCVINLPDCTVVKRSKYDTDASRIAPEGKGALHNFPGRSGGHVDLSKMLPRQSGHGEMLFVEGLKGHWYAVTDKEKKVGFGLAWDEGMFRDLWFCEEFDGNRQYPFYGNTYFLALEPQVSNTPALSDAIDDGTAKVLNAGGIVKTWLTAVVYHTDKDIVKVQRDGKVDYADGIE